jgi:hypothetical protein
MTQVATVTWTDPAVSSGQAALASLQIYAALDSGGNAGPLELLGAVNPGVQTFSTAPGQLISGSMYYFTVKATDVNNLQSQQGNWAGPLGPVGGPSAPTNVQASLNG